MQCRRKQMATVVWRTHVRCVLLAVSLSFFGSLPTFAVDWQAVNPAELQMRDLPEQPGAPAFVLYREEVDNDQQHFHSEYVRIKVLTEAGRKYADVEIPYYRQDMDIKDVHGRTIHPDGSIVEFQGKPFDKDYVKSKSVKLKMKTFSLPDVQVGSVIEYRFTARYGDDRYWAPYWVLQDDLFQRKEHFSFTPTGRDLLLSHGEIGHGLAYTWMVPKGADIKDNKGHFELDLDNVPPFVEEEHMPPSKAFKYYVRFYYRSAVDSDKYWSEEGKYWSKDVEQFVGKKKGVSEKVNSLVLTSDTPEQKVKKIYAYVGTLDNLSYHPRQTAQEQKVTGQRDNRGAEDVLRQQAGDRDDTTLLFIAMVRAAGIPAWAMVVTDRSETLFEPKYLSTDQLGSEIAIVRLNDKDVYLDPGTRFCPYGVLNWKFSATRGIRQNANGGTEIAQTPEPDYTKAVTKRVARFKMNDTGEVEGNIAAAFFGQEALIRRLEGLQTDDVGRKKIIEDEVKTWLPGNAEITMTKMPDWNAVESPLVAEFKVTSPMLNSAGKRVLLPSNPFAYDRPALFSHTERRNAVYFEYPNAVMDDVKITLPDGIQVESLPANESAKLNYALYRANRKQENNVLSLNRDLAMGSFVMAASEYKSIKDFYDKVKEYDDQQILLKRAPNVSH